MKKVLALVMCVAMIACVAVTANAATALTVTVGTVEAAKAGDVVEIPISFSEKSDIGAWEMLVSYDDAQIELVTGKSDRGEDVYFVGGPASKDCGALVEGADGGNPLKLTGATTAGYWINDTVVTIFAKLKVDLAEGETAAITAEMTICKDKDDTENSTTAYDIKVVDGGITAPEKVVVPTPTIPNPPTPNTPTGTDTPSDTHKPLGDAASVAVAAGLCAVMAAGFVFAKKAR